MSTEGNNEKKVYFCKNVLGNLSTKEGCAAEDEVQELFHQPIRIQGEDTCIQLSCAETTLIHALYTFPPKLDSRLLEMSLDGNASPPRVNVQPTVLCFRSPFCITRLLLGQELGAHSSSSPAKYLSEDS